MKKIYNSFCREELSGRSALISGIRYLLIAAGFFFAFNNNINAQCSYLNNQAYTWMAPASVGDTASTSCIYGGEFVRVTDMLAGVRYEISTCDYYSFDTQITVFEAGGSSVVGYDDDHCSPMSTLVFVPLTNGDYDIQVTRYNCLADTVCTGLHVTVLPCPPVNGSQYIYPYTSCPNTSINFQAYGDATSVSWDFGDGSPVDNNYNAYHSYDAAGTYLITLNLANDCGNDTIIYDNVTIDNSIPVADVYTSLSSTTACPDAPIYFSAWSSDGSLTYLWDFGDGSPTSDFSNVNYAYSAFGVYDATLTATNGCGNDTIVHNTVTIAFDNTPVSDVFATISPNPVCPNTNVIFNAWDWGGIASYSWDFGDGSPVSPYAYSSHSYESVGTYNASVTFTNSCGMDSVILFQVNVEMGVNPVSYANATVSSNVACPGTELTFDAYGDGDSYVWDFGDGSPVSPYSYSYHSYEVNGVYNPFVTISNACGNDTVIQLTVTITNNIPVKNVYYSISNNTVCPDAEITFQTWGDFSYVSWDFGDGSEINTNSYVYHSYPAVGNYDVTLTLTNSCGMDSVIHSLVQVMLLNIKPSFVFAQANPEMICPDGKIDFSAWSYNSGYSFTWDFGDGSPAEADGYVSHTYPVEGEYPAFVLITNGCGQDTIIDVPVIVSKDVPVSNISVYGPSPSCPNESLYFEAHADATSFIWDFGDGSPTAIGSSVDHTYSALGNYNASVWITNACGKDTLIYLTVSIVNNIQLNSESAYIDVFPNPVCPNDMVNFDVNAWDDYSYLWDFGDGTPTVSDQYTNHSYALEGTYDVSVEVTNGCGNSLTLNDNVLVTNNVPVSDFSYYVYPESVCPNTEVSFEAHGGTSYFWDYGDGTLGSGLQYSTHYYLEPGEYTATLTITNSCGNDTTVIKTVNVVNYLPINYAEMHAYPNPVCPSEMVHFDGYGDGIVNFAWDFGDGTLGSNYENPYHIYETEGSYLASVIMSNTCGNDTVIETTVDVISNMEIQYAQMSIPMYPVCPGDEVWFDAWSDGSSYIWDFGDGSAKAYGSYTYHKYPSPGSYPVSVQITNACGKDTVLNGTILVENNASTGFENIDYEAYPDLVCPNGIVTFDAWGSFNSAVWDFGDGSALYPGSYTHHSYSEAGLYYATVTMTNGCGYDTTLTLQITVDNNVIPDPETYDFDDGPMYACPGDTVLFPVSNANGIFSWDFGDGVSTSLSDWFEPEDTRIAKHAYSVEGSYTCNFSITNECGNTITVPIQVFIVNNSGAYGDMWWYNDYPGVGENVPFYAVGGSSYEWDFGDGSAIVNSGSAITSVYHSFDVPGTYLVSVTITNSCGNSTVESDLITVDSKAYCYASFEYIWDGVTSFTDLSDGNPTAWSWDFGDGTYSTLQNPEHTYAKEGVYEVSLTTFDDATGCVSSFTKTVVAGDLNCESNFTYTIDQETGIAKFTSLSNNATDYYWDFGDGDFSITANPQHTFTVPGFYTVCLYIMDNVSGCQAVRCYDLMYIPQGEKYLTADFSFYNDPSGNSVDFYDMSSANATSWYWTTGDGKVLNEQNPTYSYSKPGVYQVCLIAFDNNSGLTSTVCKNVRVGEIPCNIGSAFTYFINPQTLSVVFYSNSYGDVTDYFWTFGDGTSSTREIPLKTYDKPGYYEVSLSVMNGSGDCMDESSQVIQVGSVDCRADYSFRVDQATPHVYFSDKSKGAIDFWYWEFGDGDYSTEQNPDHLYSNGGMYMTGQTVIDNSNNCVDYTIQPVQAGEVDCSADFIAYIDSASYTGYFTSKVLGESTALLWSFGDGRLSTENDPVHKFPGEGLYSVGLNTFDLGTGCMDYTQQILLIGGMGDDCEADFVYILDPSNPDVIFNNRSVGDITASVWNFGDGTPNSEDTDPVHIYAKGGYYNVCLSVTNSAGIRNMTCKWVLVAGTTENNCHADFMYTIDSASLKVKFVDKSFGNVNKFTWDFGDSKSDSASALQNPDHTYNQKGYYLVQLTAENTTTGCVSEEFKLLNVAEQQVLKASFAYKAIEPDKKVSGYPVDLVAASSGDGATVEWDFGDKQLKKGGGFTVMDSTGTRVTHYYQKPGKYTVCVRISDPVSNQSDTYCQTVYTKYAVGVNPEIQTELALMVYPNPFVDQTTITYILPKAQFIDISIYDQLGRKIETLVNDHSDSGLYKIVWDTRTLTTGVYHLKLITDSEIVTKQLVITK
jgi:PKD repeat protein